MSISKERFVLPDRIAFIVEHCPTRSNPTRNGRVSELWATIAVNDDPLTRVPLWHRSVLGLDLLLDFSAKSI